MSDQIIGHQTNNDGTECVIKEGSVKRKCIIFVGKPKPLHIVTVTKNKLSKVLKQIKEGTYPYGD